MSAIYRFRSYVFPVRIFLEMIPASLPTRDSDGTAIADKGRSASSARMTATTRMYRGSSSADRSRHEPE